MLSLANLTSFTWAPGTSKNLIVFHCKTSPFPWIELAAAAATYVVMVIIGVLLSGFNMKGCFLDLLPPPTLVVRVLRLPYTGSFSVCDSPVMIAESSFGVGSLPPVLSRYNLAGRRSKICRILVVQSRSFDRNSINAQHQFWSLSQRFRRATLSPFLILRPLYI